MVGITPGALSIKFKIDVPNVLPKCVMAFIFFSPFMFILIKSRKHAKKSNTNISNINKLIKDFRQMRIWPETLKNIISNQQVVNNASRSGRYNKQLIPTLSGVLKLRRCFIISDY